MDRRHFINLTLASLAQLSFGANSTRFDKLDHEFAALEKVSGGRLGISVLDTATGERVQHRANERFPMCSTFKLLAVSAVLSRVDAGKEHLDRKMVFTKKDLVPYSPATGQHIGKGMELSQLCEAAITLSDNTAANLILNTLGGPSGVTDFARTLGDTNTRLDRMEPELNEARPGDERDTTTPDAMVSNLRMLVLGSALSPPSRGRLTEWLLQNKTGDERLRAGMPKNWKVGDKTGSGRLGSTNDIGVLWPPERKPVIVATYLTDTHAPQDRRNATLASVGRAIVAALA